MSDTLLYNVLGQSSFVILNKALNRALGANESMILSFLVDKRNFTNGADFFYTIDNLCYDTALGEKAVRSAMKNLIDKGILIKKDFVGLPPKQYYNINMQAILGILSNPSPKGRDIPASIDNPSQRESINPLQKATLNPSLKGRDIYNNKENKNTNIKTHYNAHASAREGGGVDFANALPLRANANPSLQAEPAMPKELKRPPSHINIAKQTSYARFCAQLGKPYDSEQESAFNEFWGLYPRKSNEIKAVEAFLNALGRGVNINTLQEQLKRFKTLLKHKSTPIDKIPFASTWLDSERYNDDLESELAQFDSPAREIEITPEQVWKRAMSELPEPSAEFTHEQLASQPAILRSYKGQKLYAGAKMHTIIGLGLGKANNKAGYVIEVTLRDERDCEVTFRFHAKNQLDFFINNYKI